MQRIELDPNSKYFKLRLPYQLGVSKIYDPKEIEKRKNDVEFKREFELQYLGKIGNVFTPQQVDHCIELGKKYSIEEFPVSLYTSKFIGLDFGFSSSATAIVAVEYMSKQYREGIVSQEILRVVDCHVIEKRDPNQIVRLCWDIYKKYGYINTWFFADAANAGMINLMKVQWDERTTWTKVEDVSLHSNKIIPVSFNANHKAMLSNLHLLVSKGYVAIDPKYDKLITAMRTAYANELSLDKQQTSYDDLLDSLRLALFQVKIE